MSATGRLALALAPSSSRSRPSPRREVRGAVRSRAVAGEPSSSPRSSRTVAARRRADAGDSCADGAPRGHEDWRVYVRSLTGLGRRAALMATVGGMSLGLRGEERSSAASVPGDEMSQQHQSDDGDDPSASAARADASEGAIASAPEADPWEGAYVKPALTVPEYIAEIEKERGEAFSTLRRLADGLKFGQLDNELLVAPFDDVKQAAYYLPWALVRRDEPAGVAAQNAWLAFRERLLELDAVAVAATRYEADEDDVLLAISRLERALDDVILAVPERFRR